MWGFCAIQSLPGAKGEQMARALAGYLDCLRLFLLTLPLPVAAGADVWTVDRRVDLCSKAHGGSNAVGRVVRCGVGRGIIGGRPLSFSSSRCLEPSWRRSLASPGKNDQSREQNEMYPSTEGVSRHHQHQPGREQDGGEQDVAVRVLSQFQGHGQVRRRVHIGLGRDSASGQRLIPEPA